ncbi:MAG: PLP-dependent aminotransferase family protein [Acidiferrobacterales bacterium]
MTMWQPNITRYPGPRYLAIAEAIQADVENGQLSSGARLPTHRDLAGHLGVTVGTVTRAYAEAMRRGLVHGEVGRGTFVRAAGDSASQFGIHQDQPGLIDLSINRPVLGVQVEALSKALLALSREANLAQLMNYQGEAGLPAHRAAGATWIGQRGVDVSGDQVVVTNGAQHALYITLAALTKPGDVVLTESLTYPGIKTIANTLDLRLLGVDMDESGPIPEAFAVACRASSARMLVCIPTIQNPTTSVIPLDRREELAEIARQHNLAIIEDDIYSFLVPDAPPPIATLAPERTYYITSLSKSMAPGLRIGYVAAPSRAVTNIAAVMRTTVWNVAPLLAEIAATWIRDGTGSELADWQRDEAHVRQAIAARTLGLWPIQTHPDALHMWLHLPTPWRASDFAAEARAQGVAVVPTEIFAVGRDLPQAVRICLSAVSSHVRLKDALEILARILGGSPDSRLAII